MLKWLFGSKSPEEIRLAERRKQTLAALEQGGIPLDARERIERENALGKEFFTSDLTAREYLLAKETGVTCIGLVMGSAFYNVSWFGLNQRQRRQTGEMLDLSRAHLDARSRAMSRMRQEAALMGASGVIGVKLESNCHEWSSRLTEFTAVGTAVRIPGWTGEPFTSALSAQEFWQLFKAGYIPHDVVMGVCSYYMYTDPNTRAITQATGGFWGTNSQNCEVELYTGGLQYAREKAMDRVTDDIKAHKAEGVVGMDITCSMEHVAYESGSTTYHDLIAHFIAFGTSVSYRPDVAKEAGKKTSMYIDLSARRQGRHGFSRLDQLGEGHTGGTHLGHTADTISGSAQISSANAPTVSE
ncbi:MAG: heavy metal-binding domain-containing protein [Cyanobacteria bacterium SZAS LIN-3]|nr:heavy metal-binding domain-containing protein [Cyanobacteria bacterium SZAS LIN-3]